MPESRRDGRATAGPPRSAAGSRSGRGGLFAAGSVYLLVTLIQVFPLLGDLLHQLPSDAGDPALNAWILWWNAHVSPLTERWWNAPAFYPAPGVLSFSEHLVGLTPLTSPIQWLTGSPELAYNVAFVLSFPLSAMAMHLLVRELTGRDDVAFVAGAAYGFSPYRVAQLSHLQVLFSFWLPLALLGLHAGLRERRWGFPLAAACWMMQGLTNGYLLLFFPVVIGLWTLWFAARQPRVAATGLAWFAAAGLVALPFLLGYRRFHAMYDMARPLAEIEFFSSDVSAILAGSDRLRLWGGIVTPGPEGELFPGFLVLALGALALLWTIWDTRFWVVAHPGAGGSRLRPWRLLLGAVAMIWGTLALASWLSGGFHINLGFASIPVVNPDKPFRIMRAAALLYLLLGGRALSRSRAEPIVGFYLLAGVLTFALCWGPSPRLLGRPFWHLGAIQPPYVYLLMLPGFDGLRVPSRFGLLWILCLSVAAALLLARTLAPRRRATVALVALGAVAIGEGWFGPVRVVPSPLTQPTPWRDTVADARAVVELPMGNVDDEVAAMLRSAVHGKPVVNGFSGYFAPHEQLIRAGLENGDLGGLEALGPYGPIAIVVHTDRPQAAALRSLLDSSTSFVRRGVWPDAAVYWLARSPAMGAAPGEPLPIARLGASVNAMALANIVDGAPGTRWTTEAAQQGGEWVQIDLGTEHQVTAVTLYQGRFADDYPRGLRADVSTDGLDWTTVFAGPVYGPAVTGALRDPRARPFVVPIRSPCRFIRLTQTGRDNDMFWSIADLEVETSPTASE